MKIARPLRHLVSIVALASFTALPTAAVPLAVTSYSTTIASGTNNLYKDSTYSGSAVTSGALLTYSGGTGKLTDGATTPGATWVAWYGESGWPTTLQHPTIVFDFGAEAAVSEVSLYFWQKTQNLIRLPTALHVDYSSDGVTYGGVQSFLIATNSLASDATGWLSFNLNGTGSHARVVLDNVGRDTFISEVQFQGALTTPDSPTVPDSVSTGFCLGLALGCVAGMREFRRVCRRPYVVHVNRA